MTSGWILSRDRYKRFVRLCQKVEPDDLESTTYIVAASNVNGEWVKPYPNEGPFYMCIRPQHVLEEISTEKAIAILLHAQIDPEIFDES